MSVVLDQFITDQPDITGIPARLAKWYSTHAAVRRLWAVENGPGLAVWISLEPTSDGGDTLPLWLAMSQQWRRDLQLICQRDIQLQIVEPDVFPSPVTGDTVIVAEIDWRESWVYA